MIVWIFVGLVVFLLLFMFVVLFVLDLRDICIVDLGLIFFYLKWWVSFDFKRIVSVLVVNRNMGFGNWLLIDLIRLSKWIFDLLVFEIFDVLFIILFIMGNVIISVFNLDSFLLMVCCCVSFIVCGLFWCNVFNLFVVNLIYF